MEQKLGRGLSAIFGVDNQANEINKDGLFDGLKTVGVNMIIPNKNQPRQHFDEEKLKELSDSIALHGVIQPLAVRKNGNDYELLAGERRLRAAKMAGLHEVPVHVVQCSDHDVLALSLIENIQRDDLNAIEEADSFRKLIAEHQCTQESLSFMVCKSRSYISNSMRLLSLPESVKELVKNGTLSSGHAKMLVGVDNAEDLARLAVENKMSVRAFEALVKEHKSNNKTDNTGTPIEKYVNQDEEEISNRITSAIGMRSKLKITAHGGILTIYCNTCEKLESLTQMLLSVEE